MAGWRSVAAWHLALEPLGALVAVELVAKLDRPSLTFDFAPLMAGDRAGKAWAIKGIDRGRSRAAGGAGVAGLGD